MRRIIPGFSLALALALSGALLAGPQGGGPDHEQLLQRMATELDLTEQQQAEVRPILEESWRQRRAVLEAHGVGQGKGRPDQETMKQMRGEMKVIRQESDGRLSKVLSAEQMKQFKELRKQARDQARQRMKKYQQEAGQ